MNKSDIEKQHQHFEEVAQKYFSARQSLRFKAIQETIWTRFFSLVSLPVNEDRPLNVLEAMCGYAEAYPLAMQHISKNLLFSGFDYSETMVSLANKRYPDINVWHQDITTFNIQNEYDIIFLIGGLHHVYKYRHQALNNVCAALKPGGVLINFEPTHNNFLMASIRQLVYWKNSFFDEDNERAFSTHELNALARDNGLEPIAQLYPGLLAYVLWYNPDAFPLLDKGDPELVKKYCTFESALWASNVARYLSFATLSCFKKGMPM